MRAGGDRPVPPQPGVPVQAPEAVRPCLRTLVAGQVVCREGDPPGPAWVVVAGSVRVYRRDLRTPNGIEVLGRLGPGAVCGEMAALLRQPRSATVQAIAPTEVLELPVDRLDALERVQPALLRVIVHALQERAGLSDEAVAALAAQHGIDVSELSGLLSTRALDQPSGVVVPPHDPQAVYAKLVTCPACERPFAALQVRPNHDRPIARDSDFHQRYATPWTPYDYEIRVCPACLYAAFPRDFGRLTRDQQARLPEVVATVVRASLGGARPDFTGERTLAPREQALHLALGASRVLEAAPLRQASLLHRLAWCARERGDEDVERRWLREALDAYGAAYQGEDLGTPRAEIRVQYLCGDLARRTGDSAGAVNWFSQVLRHPAIKQHPVWERMARDGWWLAREAAA